MIAYQEILGKERAATFVDSVQTLVEHLEVRQRQLALDLQETTATLEVFKRLSAGGNNGETIEAIPLATIAHLEQTIAPQLQAVAEQVIHETTANLAGISIGTEASTATIPSEEASTTDDLVEESEPRATKKPRRGGRSGGRKPKASTTTEETADSDTQKSARFHPRKSILREFQGMMLRDAIRMILERNANDAFSIDEIMYALYGRNISKEAFKKAKPIVISELSKGKLANHWSSVPGRRGYYMVEADADA